MKNAESIMAAFLNCCLVEKNNLFTETLICTLLSTLSACYNVITCASKFNKFKNFRLYYVIKLI